MSNTSESFDKLRLDFISTVSHELRTPLTSIRGFAETLISSKDKLSEEQQLKFLNIIKDQSNRLINLVENLLASSAQASSEEIYIFKPISVQVALEKTIAVIRQKYQRKDIVVSIPKGVPEVLVDAEKFEQVLLNIIENACKYSFENSAVFISVKDKCEQMLGINVENDGITIDELDKEKIFEKFSRLDNPMTSRTQGSGMGLYLASTMVKKMNGSIDVHSENEHTIFTINLPIATPENIAKIKISGESKDD